MMKAKSTDGCIVLNEHNTVFASKWSTIYVIDVRDVFLYCCVCRAAVEMVRMVSVEF